MALLGFCLLAIASRELTQEMDTLDILFWRSLMGFMLVLSLLMKARALSKVWMSSRLLGWHLLRNSTHFCGQCAWLIAIAALPMAEVFALEFTAPLWAALLAAIFMAEPLYRGRLLSLTLGLAGVLIILRPGAAVINPASLVMLAGATAFSVSIISTRKLTLLLRGHGHTYLLILFYMTGMQMLFSLVPIAGELQLPDARNWPWLGLAAITALGAHYCLSKALSLADAAVVMPMDYLRLPIIMLIAWWLYGETVTLALAAGAALILAGNGAGLYAEKKRLERQAALLRS